MQKNTNQIFPAKKKGHPRFSGNSPDVGRSSFSGPGPNPIMEFRPGGRWNLVGILFCFLKNGLCLVNHLKGFRPWLPAAFDVAIENACRKTQNFSHSLLAYTRWAKDVPDFFHRAIVFFGS